LLQTRCLPPSRILTVRASRRKDIQGERPENEKESLQQSIKLGLEQEAKANQKRQLAMKGFIKSLTM
jgi:hypothetical protein